MGSLSCGGQIPDLPKGLAPHAGEEVGPWAPRAGGHQWEPCVDPIVAFQTSLTQYDGIDLCTHSIAVCRV